MKTINIVVRRKLIGKEGSNRLVGEYLLDLLQVPTTVLFMRAPRTPSPHLRSLMTENKESLDTSLDQIRAKGGERERKVIGVSCKAADIVAPLRKKKRINFVILGFGGV
ncbi:aphid transmission protein [Striga asiatica]|uniref:Aphid transmission protein n=1 Tax=Striga asiatica TaxID=4170 RepID=A0A5A7QG00_STRAF|nr:aphid transmission protein [Striga asiatica]